MNPARLLYRTRQFWQALKPIPAHEDFELTETILNPAQLELFQRLQASEQAHGLRVLKALQARGESHPDLLAAALLHDVGKSRFPLRLWERVLIVLGNALCPSCVQRWGAGSASGWARAFVVAAHHAEWGAELARKAGATPLAAALIRRHQEKIAGSEDAQLLEGRLLRALQSVDNES